VFVVLCLNWYLPHLFALFSVSLSEYLRSSVLCPFINYWHSGKLCDVIHGNRLSSKHLPWFLPWKKKIALAAHMNLMGWMSEESRFESCQGQDFYLFIFFKISRPRWDPHASYYSVGSWAVSLEVMCPECEDDHSPPDAEVKNEWSYTSTPILCAFMACTKMTSPVPVCYRCAFWL
jgi:hypothetical protein